MKSVAGLHSILEKHIYQSAVTVKWANMRNIVPLEYRRYYSYYVQYKKIGDSDWTTGRIVQYYPDVAPSQATLDGLTDSTEYQVRVLGIRTLNGMSDESENPESTNSRIFTTLNLVGEIFFITCVSTVSLLICLNILCLLFAYSVY